MVDDGALWGAEHPAFPDIIDMNGLASGYGKKQVVDGVNIRVGRQEIVALIGHNGAGKSTILKVLFGLVPIWAGQIRLDGVLVGQPTPEKMLRSGIVYVPQGSHVFDDLTVRENLELRSFTISDRASLYTGIDKILTLFSPIKTCLDQKAGTLSGGEKQMLALGSALLHKPRLLLLDEPSLGLSPALASKILAQIVELPLHFHTSIVLVEQKVREALKISHRVYVLRQGRISFEGTPKHLDDAELRAAYF